jgi:hypothetical protein
MPDSFRDLVQSILDCAEDHRTLRNLSTEKFP